MRERLSEERGRVGRRGKWEREGRQKRERS